MTAHSKNSLQPACPFKRHLFSTCHFHAESSWSSAEQAPAIHQAPPATSFCSSAQKAGRSRRPGELRQGEVPSTGTNAHHAPGATSFQCPDSCVLQVLGEPRAREVLPPQMTAEYVRKLLDVFRVCTALAYTPLHSKALPNLVYGKVARRHVLSDQMGLCLGYSQCDSEMSPSQLA